MRTIFFSLASLSLSIAAYYSWLPLLAFFWYIKKLFKLFLPLSHLLKHTHTHFSLVYLTKLNCCYRWMMMPKHFMICSFFRLLFLFFLRAYKIKLINIFQAIWWLLTVKFLLSFSLFFVADFYRLYKVINRPNIHPSILLLAVFY